MNAVYLVCVVVLTAAAVLTLARVTMGPTMLDRSVALDVLISIVICGLAVEAAWNQHLFTLPTFLVLALLGFTGSVSVARYIRGFDDIEDEEDGA